MKFCNSKNIALVLTLLICIAPLALPTGVSAQASSNSLSGLLSAPTTYTPLAPLPDVTSSGLSSKTTIDFKTYITYAFNLLIALGAVAAVFMITWGGFEYMTTDAVQGKKEGITKIQNAIYGLLLILSSYLILRTIDPRFVNISATLVPPLKLKAPTGLNSWDQLLVDVAKQIDSNNTTIKSDLQTVTNDVSAADANATNIASQISSYTGEKDPLQACSVLDYSANPDPQLSKLCADYFSALDSKQSAIADGTAKVQAINFNTQAETAIKFPSEITSAQIQALDKQYNADQKLVTTGETASDLQSLNNAYYSARAVMQVAVAQNMANSFVPGDYLNQINDAIINDLPRISDPVVQQTAVNQAIITTEDLMTIHRSNVDVYNQLKKYDSQLKNMLPSNK